MPTCASCAPTRTRCERAGDEGELIATERTILERPRLEGRRAGNFRTWLIGRPIHSEREEHERLTKVKGLAIFSSDNISSSAYGPEEMIRVLAFAGTGALVAHASAGRPDRRDAGDRHPLLPPDD